MPDGTWQELTIELSHQAFDCLKRLHATGLYGFTVEETAERFICDGIIDGISRRIIAKHRAEMGVGDA